MSLAAFALIHVLVRLFDYLIQRAGNTERGAVELERDEVRFRVSLYFVVILTWMQKEMQSDNIMTRVHISLSRLKCAPAGLCWQ